MNGSCQRSEGRLCPCLVSAMALWFPTMEQYSFHGDSQEILFSGSLPEKINSILFLRAIFPVDSQERDPEAGCPPGLVCIISSLACSTPVGLISSGFSRSRRESSHKWPFLLRSHRPVGYCSRTGYQETLIYSKPPNCYKRQPTCPQFLARKENLRTGQR